MYNIDNTVEHSFWNKNFVLLIISNILLYVGVYMLFPVLHSWITWRWGYSDLDASLVSALFGIGMFLPGALNSYLIDRFRRKKVCTRSILLFALLGILYPYAEHEWMLCVLRILQGALFGIALMVTGSTLVIDVTPSSRRSKANWVFAFSGALGMLVGVSAGLFFSSLLPLNSLIYASALLSGISLLLVSMIEICFRAPLEPPLFSFDRFILFRNIPPGINMMTVPFILGTLIAYKNDSFFYLCVALGFILFWFMPRAFKVKMEGRLMVIIGNILIAVSLYVLSSCGGIICTYVAGVVAGLGIASAMCQYLKIMIRLPMHCERGTGYNTYQLMWEAGIMLGVNVGCFICVSYGCSPILLSAMLCVAGVLDYVLFTHRYFQKRMKDRISTIK